MTRKLRLDADHCQRGHGGVKQLVFGYETEGAGMSDDEEFAGDAVFCSWEVAGTVLVRGSLARAAG
ncbi:MAG TPA: hypothetical protein PLW35_02790, partial [Verrucomicrobiota bacterium]|nr:hypothetical protein [Verrucomicrobiota bacterium]